MPGSFHNISSLTSALSAFQRAIDVTGSNIANANTRGYSRRRVDLASNPDLPYYSRGYQSLGSGVSVASINRVRDAFLDRSASRSQSLSGEAEARASHLANLEAILGEPADEGISKALGKVFDAWASLGASPNSSAARTAVRSAAESLTAAIRDSYQRIESEKANASAAASADFARINELASEISALNTQIAMESSGGPPNELLDRRQNALDELSSLIKIETQVLPSGVATVTAAGINLVDISRANPLDSSFDPAKGPVDPNLMAALRGGSFLGHLKGMDDSDSQMAWLDDLALQLKDQFNAIHTTGKGADGSTGVSFFSTATTGAKNIDLSAEIKASVQAIAAGVSGEPGDGGLAQNLSNLRSQTLAGLNGRTFEGFFNDAVLGLGASVREAQLKADTESAVMSQIESQRQSLSGVNLDEEFADMVRFQRSYQAAARALSIADQITEDLLGIIR